MEIKKFSREIEIILWVIKNKNSSDHSIFGRENFKTDWDLLLTASIKHGILPLVYKKLASFPKKMVPTSSLLKFKSFYLRILQNNLNSGNQLKNILTVFKDKNIQAIPLKGPILSIQAYGDLGFRIFDDLDILINYKDFSKVYDTMIKSGYKPSSLLSKKKQKMWIKAGRDIEFLNPESRVIIDVHQRLSQGYFLFKVSEKELEINNFVYLLDQKIKVLSPENTILYMIINHTKDQWNFLKMVSDLSFFLYNNPEINWNKLLQKAKKMGALRMVLAGFLLLKDLVNESFPDLILQEMEKDKKIHGLIEKYKNQLFSDNRDQKTGDRITAISETLDSNRYRFLFLLHFIFFPTPKDFRVIKLPDFFYPLYYLFRPLRLLTLLIINNFKSKTLEEKEAEV